MVNNKQLWGGRFTKALAHDVEQFHSSIKFDQRLYKHDINGSKAHVEMLIRQKLIDVIDGEKIIAGLDHLLLEIEKGKAKFDTSLEDIHMNIEFLLTQNIGEAAKKLHTARSRNDQVALDLRLFMREEIDNVISLLNDQIEVLAAISEKHNQTLMPGYTHLQKAQPITLAVHLNAYIAMFSRDISRLEDCRKRLNLSPLGAGALAGSRLNIDRAYVAEMLGFDGVVENTIDAVSDRDHVIEFSSASSIIMMHLSRLSEELILWASAEFNFIKIDDSYATGSSLMPNKKNPDVPELVRGKSGRVYGNLMSILTIMKSLPLAYNKDTQEDKEGLFDTVDTVKACLAIMTKFLQNISFNEAIMKTAVGNGFIWATAIVEYLVLKGLAFRDAHEVVGKIIRHCTEHNINFSELTLGQLQDFCQLFTQSIEDIIKSVPYVQ